MAMTDERALDGQKYEETIEEAAQQPQPQPVPLPQQPPRVPRVIPFSGLYQPTLVKSGTITGQLRLDVDGRYPQMKASGSLNQGLSAWANWVASVAPAAPGTWAGNVIFKEQGGGLMPHTQVSVSAVRGASATVVFSGGGAPDRTMKFPWASSAFHSIEMEFDAVAGTTAVTTVDTGDHPNHPAGLADEVLSIETIYRRAGFTVTKSGGDGVVPLAGAGANAKWSNMEMHDAMQTSWSRFANKAQWSVWTLFASLHEQGTSLGGIMFDDIGPQQRQGTAIFEDAFIATPPPGDVNPTAWVRRMRFWTAVHEMGHTFNLAHSWQKALVDSGHGPWIPLANQPEARSFMNYPYNVAGGQTAFFANFDYRFSDDELVFLRHAPSRFVQQGNALWFDHHGFEQTNVSPEPALRLELRVNRPVATYAFMEPVNVELKLTNVSAEPVLVPDTCLRDMDGMTVIVKRHGGQARRQLPYAHLCLQSRKQALAPGESIYGAVPVSVGLTGWNVDEPGVYKVQVALHLADEDIVSNPLALRVEAAAARADERLAVDFFTDDVGRVLTFGGTRVLTAANDTLQEVAERMKGQAPAVHAQVALGRPYAIPYKLIHRDANPSDAAGTPGANGRAAGRVEVLPADPEQATGYLGRALLDQPDAAAQALGHIRYKREVDRYADKMADQGETGVAAAALATLEQTLAARQVKPSVVAEVTMRKEAYARAAK